MDKWLTGLAYFLIFFVSCSKVPDSFIETNTFPSIFPEYMQVTVPVNIAPLNFRVEDETDKIIVCAAGRSSEIKVCGTHKAVFPLKRWHSLLEENRGGSIQVQVYSLSNGQWRKYLPFAIFINDSYIDNYLVYRMIAPGYQAWSSMGIYQRNLTSFDEDVILDNTFLPAGTCMNCHTFRNNEQDKMVFHLRGLNGGTYIVDNTNVNKFDTKTEKSLSKCVYPYWHPSGKYVAFSLNKTSQSFHSGKDKRIEVYDSASDVAVYDVENNVLITDSIISSGSSFETFPAFSPDGRKLYFCSAAGRKMPDLFKEARYDLCCVDFYPEKAAFGNVVDTVVKASSLKKSISFPRVSPNGKYLMFTMADYGTFPVWHKEADLFVFSMEEGIYKPVDNANSKDTESFHSWSSGSDWFVFSSRRVNGLYTMPFISYFDEKGNAGKPFLVPQKDPDFYDNCIRSFNVPVFIKEKFPIDGRNMNKAIKGRAKEFCMAY